VIEPLHATQWAVEDGVGLLTLDRPERLNAWTDTMASEVAMLLADADADPAVRVVVITGAGRGFCAGADMRALDQLSDAGGYDALPPREGGPTRAPLTPSGRHAALAPLEVRKPVIAAVNGPVAGIGFVLFAMCDLRYAAEGVKITTSFARLGLPAEHAVSWVLPRIIGMARAADLLLSSRVVLADEAERMGLVNGVLPAADLLPRVLADARRLASECSPASFAVIKAQLLADQHRTLDEAAVVAGRLMDEMLGSPDFVEGVAAHAARRSPVFAPLSGPASGAAPNR
jgi:enoyl-CoA hydratase/carnithine racemase